MKKIFFILLIPSVAFANGPLFQHKDTFVNQEFDNVYQDLTRKVDRSTATVGRLLLPNGTAAAPPLSFTNDLKTGVFLNGTSQLAFSANGTLIGRFTPSGLNIDTGSLFFSGSNPSILTGGGSALVIVMASTGTSILATTTNNNAAPGWVGESSATSKAVLTNIATSSVWQDYDTLNLTAGDWLVSGCMSFVTNTSTSVTQVKAAISTNSGATTTDHVFGDNENHSGPPVGAYNVSPCIVDYRLSVSAQTLIYFKGLASFTSGTPQFTGRMRAWRPR